MHRKCLYKSVNVYVWLCVCVEKHGERRNGTLGEMINCGRSDKRHVKIRTPQGKKKKRAKGGKK